MTFVSVLLALILEQFRPLPARNPVYSLADDLVRAAARHLNAGERRHGVVAWWLLIGGVFASALTIDWLCGEFGGWLTQTALAVVVLYLTLGFRQFSHPFTEIQFALETGNLAHARAVLTEWMQETYPEFSADRLEAGDVTRHAIERALMLSHRHVFGVFFWFVLCGPAGAIAYRLAAYTARIWPGEASGEFGRFAQQAFNLMDWLPVRLSAIGFAIVGNFEDAMYGWRNFAARWSDPLTGVVLAAGGGALGVRLGGGRDQPAASVPGADSGGGTFELPPGIEAEPAHLRSAVGLVWRAMALWTLLLFLLSLSRWTA